MQYVLRTTSFLYKEIISLPHIDYNLLCRFKYLMGLGTLPDRLVYKRH